jgi:SAM-dependent methyltransferase
MTLGDKLDYKTDEFDAVISVGVFTMGHAPSSSFDELIRVTKPGGYIAFSLRVDMYQDAGFKEKQSALETAGAWKLTKVTDSFQPLPKGEPEVFHQIWAYQVI